MKPHNFKLKGERNVELRFMSIGNLLDKPGYDLYINGEKVESEVPIVGTWNYRSIEDEVRKAYEEASEV